MGKLELNQEVGVHNKFHIIMTDIRTGEVKQEAWAYNLILNAGFDKIMNNLLVYEPNGNYTDRYQMMRSANVSNASNSRFGGNVHIGTGVGVLNAARTELFEFYKGFYGSYYESGWDAENLSGFYVIKVTIPHGEQYPAALTEVGLASFTSKTNLSTHALLEDSEGKQIYLNPGPYDQLTIYATSYIELANIVSGNNIRFVGGNNNFFKKVFVDNQQVVSRSARFAIELGKSSLPISLYDPAVVTTMTTIDYYYNSGIAMANNSLKKIVFDDIRIPSTSGNDSRGVREIGFNWHGYPVFRSVLPIPGVWTGKDIEDEEVDTGDGNTTVFNLKWPDIVYESEKIYVQGRSPELQARGTDYTMSDPETSEITFAVAPANGAAITANYAVDYIPKDENHVLDISFTFSFKDANAE